MEQQDAAWSEKERLDITTRLLALHDDQLGVMFALVGGFYREDWVQLLADVRVHGAASHYVTHLFAGVCSKGELLGWLQYFERFN